MSDLHEHFALDISLSTLSRIENGKLEYIDDDLLTRLDETLPPLV